MQDAERKDRGEARATAETGDGMALRATRRGALVLQTENARRMMRRFAKLRPAPDSGSAEDAGTAAVRP